MKRILIQLDADERPSVFDRVVAFDAGADEVLSYGGVEPQDVRDLVYGAIFTRGPKDLKSTALFVGGTDVGVGEQIFAAAQDAFIGPLRVSLLLDCAGANTTAAAAVVAASRHRDLAQTDALVLAATGSVGRRAALLLAREGARVRVASRRLDRAAEVAQEVERRIVGSQVQPFETGSSESVATALDGAQLVIAAGSAGVQLLPRDVWAAASGLEVIVDLNAVPPLGVEGVEGTDAAQVKEGRTVYGAIGVGGLKMKIHKAAVARLFEENDLALDAVDVFDIGSALG